MMDLHVTDDIREQIERGGVILKEKSGLYNETLLSHIRDTIAANMPDAGPEEREEMLLRSIYDYWVYGNNIDEEFYYGLYRKSDEEKRTYLNAKNHVLYSNHLNDKEGARRLNKYNAYCELKPYYKREVIYVDESGFDDFSAFVDRHPEFVVKPDGLGLATGVYKASVASLGGSKETAFREILARADATREDWKKVHYSTDLRSGAILEEIIDQAEEMSAMHPASVNGVRCTTICVDGKVHVYYPWFKIGTNGKFITGEAFGDLMAGINAETGIVDTYGFNEESERFEYHPNTGVRIPGFQIPRWGELLDILDVIGRHFGNVNYIGWDMALTKDGWCIMEGNVGGEPLWQLLYGRGMKADLEELIGWKPEKRFWWE